MQTVTGAISTGQVVHVLVGGYSGIVARLADGHAYFFDPCQKYLHCIEGEPGVSATVWFATGVPVQSIVE